MEMPYIATCRDKDCYMHKKPARFADYQDRAIRVGEHRVTTGHMVDMTKDPDPIAESGSS